MPRYRAQYEREQLSLRLRELRQAAGLSSAAAARAAGFSQVVVVGIETATANIQDPRDIAVYLSLFEAVEAVAVFGDDARSVLSRVAADYRVL